MMSKKKMGWVRVLGIFLVFALISSVAGMGGKVGEAKNSGRLKSACAAAVKATGNVKKLTFKTSTPSDFDAISFRHDKKVRAIYYVADDKTVYNICAVEAKTVSNAKKIYKAFAEYKESRLHNEYFKTDYSKTEQNVMKNAIYGIKGKYVWYISMSSKKKNEAGQIALKKKL